MKAIYKKIVPSMLDKDGDLDLNNTIGFSVQNKGTVPVFISNLDEAENIIEVPPGGIRAFGETVGVLYSGTLYVTFDEGAGANRRALVIRHVQVIEDC